MSSYRIRKNNISERKKLQQGFNSSWNKSPKSFQYNAFEDKHNNSFFKLPVIQSHLKKLKRRAKKQPGWTENTQLIKEINKKLQRQKKEGSLDLPSNLKVYIDDYIQDFNREKGTGKIEGSKVQKSGRHRKTQLRVLFKNNDMMKVISPGRTKTQAKQTPKNLNSLNHDKFLQYLQKKKLQISQQKLQKSQQNERYQNKKLPINKDNIKIEQSVNDNKQKIEQNKEQQQNTSQ